MCFACIAEESGRFAEGLRGSKTIGPDVSSDDLLGDARIAIIVRLITRSTHGCGKQMGSNGNCTYELLGGRASLLSGCP